MNLIELTKKLRPLADGKFLLAVSGGADSMALFHVFLHFKKHFQFEWGVTHFHHGPSNNPAQVKYRFVAWNFVREQCQKHGIAFFSNYTGDSRELFMENWPEPLSSEADFRRARYRFCEQVMANEGFRWLVLAHHEEDLLETRLIRLIRGTGATGLQAMTEKSGFVLRPLLGTPQKDLRLFLAQKNADFLEDPSNRDFEPLRNWIRHSWLPQLEQKRPGSVHRLHQSLDHLVSSLDQSLGVDSFVIENSIMISDLMSLPEPQRRQLIAAYMKGQGLKNYGVSHIDEIIKRLDRNEKSHTFKMLGRRWKVDAGRMSLEAPS